MIISELLSIHTTKHECLFDGNRLHIYYTAKCDGGYRATGPTRAAAVANVLKLKEK